MIQPSHLVPPSAGTGSIVAATPPSPTLQQAHGNGKITVPRHRSRPISRSTRIGVVSFERQAIGQPSLELLSP